MKITPSGNTPPAIIQAQTVDNSAARARAIAVIAAQAGEQTPAAAPTQGQAQETAVQNPNKVSPEEMSAVKAPTQAPETTQESTPVVAEAAATETPLQQVKDPETERRFQDLAKQERMLRARDQKQQADAKVREAAVAAREAALATRERELETGYIPKSKLKMDPIAALADAETSYDAVTEAMMAAPLDPRIQNIINNLQNELKSIKTANEELKTTQTTQQAEQYQGALKQIESQVKKLVNSNPVDFEAIIKTASHNEVVKLIEKTWNEDKILLTEEEAAKEVEDYLLDSHYETVSKIDKLKKRLTPTPPVSTPAPVAVKEDQTQPKQQQMKTLTNLNSSTRRPNARERAIARGNGFKGEF